MISCFKYFHLDGCCHLNCSPCESETEIQSRLSSSYQEAIYLVAIGLDSGAVVSTSADCANGVGAAVADELPKGIACDSGDSCSVGY
jgi:hypothetical protein